MVRHVNMGTDRTQFGEFGFERWLWGSSSLLSPSTVTDLGVEPTGDSDVGRLLLGDEELVAARLEEIVVSSCVEGGAWIIQS
jgi:hypothetical protein